MATLEVRHVSQAYEGLRVLDDVSLRVAHGTVACLLGPSGCGKTTLFHIVAGLELPLCGTVELDGEDVTGISGQLSYMLQKDLLLKEKTVLDNVALPLVLQGARREEAREKAASHFARFGLAGTEEMYPSQLSGGMRQRAALLRSYLFNADFMLLDEPFSALDAFTKADMHRWFTSMAQELSTTALVVTHDVDEALVLADTVYVMQGRPRVGEPTRIAGAVEVPVPRVEREGFSLTPGFLACKREVLGLLG